MKGLTIDISFGKNITIGVANKIISNNDHQNTHRNIPT